MWRKIVTLQNVFHFETVGKNYTITQNA